MTNTKNAEQAGFDKADRTEKSDNPVSKVVTTDDMEKVAGGDQGNAPSLGDVVKASW